MTATDEALLPLKWLAHYDTAEMRATGAFVRPRVLSHRYHLQAAAALDTQKGPEAESLRPILEELRGQRAALDARQTPYSINLGPVERLLQQYSGGEISRGYALEQTREADFAEDLIPPYVRALALFGVRSAQEGEWQSASRLLMLLHSALEAGGDRPYAEEPEMAEAVAEAVAAYLEAAQIALMQVPDGRLYRDALRVGKAAAEAAQAAGDNARRGTILYRIGVLHLDPYVAGRVNLNYDQQHRQWLRRVTELYGEEIYAEDEATWKMPTPQEALRLAESYLRQAVPLLEGDPKGRALKALAETLNWQEGLKELGGFPRVDRKEVAQLCRDALTLLDPDEPSHRLDMLSTLLRLGEKVDAGEVDRVLGVSLDEHVRRRGAFRTLDMANQAVNVLRQIDGRRALSLLRDARPLLTLLDDDRLRSNHLFSEIQVLVQALAPPFPKKLPPEGIAGVAEQMREQAEREGWDVRRLCAGLVGLAGAAGQSNSEETGLGLLQEAAARAPLFAQEFEAALACLQAQTWLGLAVNHVNTEEWPEAAAAYTIALGQFLDQKLSQMALECLRRIDDLSSRRDPKLGLIVANGLAPLALRLERDLGDTATGLLRHLTKHTLADMATGPLSIEDALFQLQMVKGLRFATALYSGSRYRARDDEEGRDLLSQIERARAALPADVSELSLVGPEAALDQEWLLGAYVRSGEGQGGDDPAERLANLQARYDAQLSERLMSGVPTFEALYLRTGDVQSSLDERTVLLYYYLGATASGNIAVYVFAMTREEVRGDVISHPFPDSELLVGEGDQKMLMTPFALTIQDLRRGLRRSPGARFAAKEAEATLEVDLRGYLGHLLEHLGKLRAQGKDHLCIVPHGPLHYYPFHLLGPAGKPLADEWIVTYLPNLHLLISRRGQPAVRAYRPKAITAIGLALEALDPKLGLQPLLQAPEEARAVASIFGAEPVPEAAATQDRVEAALQESRYVHIATHGWHNAGAPAFQCVQLTPDGESDGRLYAHEVLQLDLRGLELLTLSACETALGRFDPGDNLRGLPASFLFAGVETIVGTLWPVETNASARFFTALYQELKVGKNRLDAFSSAQRQTRAGFPKYRDWGPFYLMGEWL